MPINSIKAKNSLHTKLIINKEVNNIVKFVFLNNWTLSILPHKETIGIEMLNHVSDMCVAWLLFKSYFSVDHFQACLNNHRKMQIKKKIKLKPDEISSYLLKRKK